jgi:glycosyltransferase involved in cell wall biosynthesis
VTRVALVDQVGTGSGVGSFLRGLAGGLLSEARAEEWAFRVFLPERDYVGEPVTWPRELTAANLDARLAGDATGRFEGVAWIQEVLRSEPFDAAYFAYPYLASCPQLESAVVATTHDFNHKLHGTWSPELRATVDRQLEGWLHRADAVVVSSDFIAAELAAYYPAAAGKARTVRLGVPASPPSEQTAAAPGPPFLLTVGWVARHKNQALLFRALGRLRARGVRLRLLLVGPNAHQVHPERAPRQSYAWHLVRLAEAAGLEPDVDYLALGYVDRDRLEGLYRSAVALVTTTLYEAGSFPVREALRLGCPSVCSDVPALAEDARLLGGGVRLFDALDPDALADALAAALAEAGPRRREAESRAGAVEHVFDWRRTARGYLAAFRAAIAARQAA